MRPAVVAAATEQAELVGRTAADVPNRRAMSAESYTAPMRRSLALVGIALCGALLLGACSSGSSDTTVVTTDATADETFAAETEAPATEAVTEAAATKAVAGDSVAMASDDPSSMAGQLASSFKESTGVDLTKEQGVCMTDAILSAFTAKELIDLGKSPAGFDGLSAADKARAVGSFQKCPGILEEAFFAGFKTALPTIDEAQGRCGATELGKAFSAEELVALSTGGDVSKNTEVMTKVFTAFGNCDGLLSGLFAAGIKESGRMTDAQANCAAEAMVKALGVETMVKFSIDPNSIDPAVTAKLTEALTPCLSK